LWNFRARLYDNEVGLFYAVDPAYQSWSSMGYALGNPMSFVDPDGRQAEDDTYMDPWVREYFLLKSAEFSHPFFWDYGEKGNGWTLGGFMSSSARSFGLGVVPGNGGYWIEKSSRYRVWVDGAKEPPWKTDRWWEWVKENATKRAPDDLTIISIGDFDLTLLDFAGVRALWTGARAILGRAATHVGTKASRGYTVYKAIDAAGDAKYYGITFRELAKRMAEHMRRPEFRDLTFEIVERDLTKTQARVLEQQLINQRGLGSLINKINSIDPNYWEVMGVLR
jgi:hypothetical protein